jgi:predicted nucleic acid-binding protein
VTDATARNAGRPLRRHRRPHPGIDLADHLIAATAEEADATLVTLNVKHFPMFADLRPPWPQDNPTVLRLVVAPQGADR